MSAGAQIDYEALAKQAGATSSQPAPAPGGVDYAALAKKAGAISSQPAPGGNKSASLLERAWEKVNEMSGKALAGAGLPQSISDIPDWFQHLTGTHPKSEPFWAPIKKAITNPTEENIANAVPFIGPASVSMSKDVRAGNYLGAGATLAGTVAAPLAAGEVKPGITARQELANAKTGAPAGSTFPQRMYQSALKPGPGSYSTGQVRSMVQTGLEEKIPVSTSGVEKLWGLIDDLNAKIKAQIDRGATAGKTVNKYDVTSRLSATAKKFQTQVNPEADLAAVGESGNEFLRNQPTEIPIDQAQAMKTGTYQQLKGRAYGELKSATVEAQKSLARGLKEEIAQQFPEVADMNARESQLLNLDGALERAVRRVGNHQLIGIGTPIAAGAAGAISKSTAVGAIAGLLKAIFDDPLLKSKLAIALNRKGVRMFAANARVAAYVSALGGADTSQRNAHPDGEQ